MKKRSQFRRRRENIRFVFLSSLLTFILLILLLLGRQWKNGMVERSLQNRTKTARIMASGDILVHDVLYMSALKSDGTYDFNPYFMYAKDWLQSADLAIGDYEGTISSEYPLSGYPLFNAPKEIAETMKAVGYDVVDLAHNHILDSHISGAFETMDVFDQLGLSTIGVYQKDRDKEPFLIKNINGIKIAILGYSYGYNGMEATLTPEEYKKHMSDLDRDKIREEIKEADKLADVTIVMPQMGVEYELQPTEEQEILYRDMIDWGADVVFGGHPHVPEPTETITKNGEKKLIVYSMGNFISNQTFERLGNPWTERGVLMDLIFEKKGDQTVIKTAEAHPTMVWVSGKGSYDPTSFYEYMDYRVMVLEDFIKGGKHRNKIPTEIQEKVDIAYEEMNEHMDLNW